MSTEVDAQLGIIDKFIGDAVMAVFGVPDAQSNSELSGINCALSLLDKVKSWNDYRTQAQQPEFRITIGVHCGEVFAGAVGTQNRMEFTVLGDTVNIAARLQEIAKSTISGLVVSQNLLENSGCFSASSQKWRALAENSVRGRVGRISLYEYVQ